MLKHYLFITLAAFSSVMALAQKSVVTHVTPQIVRVQWNPAGEITDNNTGVCVYQPVDKAASEQNASQKNSIYVHEDPTSGSLTFVDRKTSEIIIMENPFHPHEVEQVVQERVIYDEQSAHVEETANGKVTVKDVIRRDTIGTSTRYTIRFVRGENTGIYGLGAHMEDYMNLDGKTLYLTQHNLKAMVPFLISPKGYGILFDAGCAMKFVSGGSEITMQLEAAKTLDYYLIKGNNMDEVIAGYHYLTGNVSMMPRYVFGYTQSKERYCSSDELISIVREYRQRQVPLDMVVQDWNYWPQGWGYMKMDPRYYPDPKALADSIHAMNAKLMVSIWPNPQWCPEAEDFKQRGFMLEHDVYDVFNPEAREYYWSYANNEFFSRGFDAWWCDSSEPLDGDWNQLPAPGPDGKPYSRDDHERRWQLNKDVLSESLGLERSSLYSLYHSKGIYENQRKTTSFKRVVNLTRSTYAGQQRYGTIVWNGDTYASWQSFRQQIPAGLNYMATGNPYWTVDVGSFFSRGDGRRWFYTGEFPKGCESDEYRDYYVRMFQWATFLPMLRSHGSDTPREIWRFGEPGTRYYEAILSMINLRYKLVPYIYSMAARQSMESYTMARMLAFDFADDPEVLDLKDEYMFGDMLVCPVTQPNATSRIVYLPKGSKWIDFWTGETFEGGQKVYAFCGLTASSDTHFGQGVRGGIPVFVKAGSIIPSTEVAQCTAEQVGLPLTLNVYPGKDASFVLYEDEGDNYNFELGGYTTIPLTWNDQRKQLTIGACEGYFFGMQLNRTFVVHTPYGDKQVKYHGKKVTVKF